MSDLFFGSSKIGGGVGDCSIDGTTASVCCLWIVVDVEVKSTGGKLVLGARNGPLVFNVDEIFDEGKGISIVGKLDFGAAIVWVLSFGAADLFPKHEQSARVEDFFFIWVLVSIGCCFSGDFIAGTIFDGGLGTSSSNDGGGDWDCLGKVKTGSGEGNWKS